MNMPASIVDAQVERLLQVVTDYESQQRNRILEQARAEGHKVIVDAYSVARARLHKDIDETRERVKSETASARARQQSKLKQHEHLADLKFLHHAWYRLTEALQERWRKAEARQTWVENVVSTAFSHLEPGPWSLEHPIDWLVIEKTAVLDRIYQRTHQQPTPIVNKDIHAGLRINFNGATIDGTISGLLSNRARIEAELLALCRGECVVTRK